MTLYLMLRRWHGEATNWTCQPPISELLGELWTKVLLNAVLKRKGAIIEVHELLFNS